jgi:hypothetical protein
MNKLSIFLSFELNQYIKNTFASNRGICFLNLNCGDG